MAIDKTQSIAKDLSNLYIQYFNQRKGDFRQPINLSLNNPTNLTINDNERIIEYDLDVIPVYETLLALLPGQAIGIYDSGMVYQSDVIVPPIIPPLTSPRFVDNIGDAQNWIRTNEINLFRVPMATGYPIPVYSVIGNLPIGINFNPNTRIISGTPIALGSGTIRIRASNSEGNDDWTVDYNIEEVLSLPRFIDDTGDAQDWTQNTAINAITVPQAIGYPVPIYSVVGNLPVGLVFNVNTRVLSGTPTQVNNGIIRIRATNSEGNDDWTIEYTTIAENILTIPRFIDNTGDEQNWVQNTAINSITIPEATGNPIPTYSVIGNLPTGLNFNVNTRVLNGTPTEVGNGIIRIRATNSEGNDDWTLAYNTVAEVILTAPSFVDDTGDEQDWIQNTEIISIIVPAANGNPNPVYTITNLPDGLNFNVNTRTISGTPTAVGSGTITVTATNSEGDDNWTIDYTTTQEIILTVPFFLDDTGDVQDWITTVEIIPIVVPIAGGNPTPVYSVVGNLPAGLVFNADTRVISGTPTIISSGTISIRATNSEGHDEWTVDYSITTSVIITPAEIIDVQITSSPIAFVDTYGINEVIEITVTYDVPVTVVGFPRYPVNFGQNPAGSPEYFNYDSGSNSTEIIFTWIVEAAHEDTNGIFLYGAARSILLNGGTIQNVGTQINADLIPPANTRGTQRDHKVAGYLGDVTPVSVPSFIDNTGDTQNWNKDVTIDNITVPEANGSPTPTYIVIGNLPDGINFNANTRVLSGTPTAIDSGTITIRAMNSEGDDDWTIDYTISSNTTLIPVYFTTEALLEGQIIGIYDSGVLYQ